MLTELLIATIEVCVCVVQTIVIAFMNVLTE